MNKKTNKKLMEIYDLLLDQVGSRQWWPADTKFEMIVGAILTQFVSWKNVTQAINNLKRENILTMDGICRVDEPILEELIRSTRFYKQKVKKLKDFCAHVRYNYESDLDDFLSQEMGSLRLELLSLYGIGKETADCIILYAAEKPIFVVDTYTRRVFHKLGIFEENSTYDEMQNYFMDHLESNVALFNEYHAQIDGIGSRYCFGKNPKCEGCPLKTVCKGKQG